MYRNSNQSGTTIMKEPKRPHPRPISSRTVGDWLFLKASIIVRNIGLISARADAGPAGPKAIAF